MRFKALDRKKITLAEKRAASWFIENHPKDDLTFAVHKPTQFYVYWYQGENDRIVISYPEKHRKPRVLQIRED